MKDIRVQKRQEALLQRRLEREAIQEFMAKYGDEVVQLSGAIKKMAKDKRSEKEISDFISKNLKTDIPEHLLPVIMEYTERIWSSGAELITDAGTIIADVARDQDAIDFFVKQQRFDFGKILKGMDKELKQATLDSIRGVGKNQKEIIELLDKAVPKIMKDRHTMNHYRMVISNAANKSRNFSRTLTFEEIGVQKLEIVAIIDRKTSDICRTMNGRRIEVKRATSYVREVMATDPDEVVKKYPWPKSVPTGVSTENILDEISVTLPPYHGRCRTTTVVGLPERIVTQTGKSLQKPVWPESKEIEKIVDDTEKGRKRKLYRDRLARTKRTYKGLTPEEIASKINSARGSRWEDVKHKQGEHHKKFQDHFERHKNSFKKYGKKVLAKTEEEYIGISEKVLKEFDRVFPHAHAKDRKRVAADRIGFYNEKMNVVSIVDLTDHRIVSCFAPESIDELYEYSMELK